jgi:hypothetical protein
MIFTIANLERNTETDGVIVAHWRASKTSGDYTAATYGTASFTPDSTADGFIPFDELTEADVIGWLQDALDTDALEERLVADLAEQASPSVLTGVPWVAEETN